VNGPSAADVAHNFMQRWNGATECDPSEDLPVPSEAFAPRGPSAVQIQRMFGADRSILEQYEQAIDAAERSIYIENQAIPIPRIAQRLDRALARGVEVVLLVPAIPEEGVYAARRDPARRPLFEGLEALGRHPNFRLAGIPVYVHAKLMIVDETWATIGSCNLHRYSMGGHSEMNASIWDAEVARNLRETLRRKHEGDMFTLSPELYAVSR
jgi:cardiolipin synthase